MSALGILPYKRHCRTCSCEAEALAALAGLRPRLGADADLLYEFRDHEEAMSDAGKIIAVNAAAQASADVQ